MPTPKTIEDIEEELHNNNVDLFLRLLKSIEESLPQQEKQKLHS